MENKSGWTLQNLHCNTAAALQSRHRKHFPCFYQQVTETQISEDVWENTKCFWNQLAAHAGKHFQLFQFFPNAQECFNNFV